MEQLMLRPRRKRRGRLRRVVCCVPIHCEYSDPVWEAYFDAGSPGLRWMFRPVLRAAQMTAILPPPPGRMRSLQALVVLVLACLASAVAQRTYVRHAARVFEEGFHVARHAYLVENLLEVMQTPIILVATWCNLSRFAPVLAQVVSGPVRPAPVFVAFTFFVYLTHVIAQALFHVAIFKMQAAEYICYSVAAAWSGFSALILDRLVALVLTFAALKIRAVNQRLSSLPTKRAAESLATSDTWMTQDPAVQRGLLQTVATRWESTMEQVTALLGHDMLGLPLLYSLLHITIGLVTASSLAIRDETQADIRLIKLIHVVLYLSRVASLALTAGWLYREAKETEAIIGALDTTAWPIRERQRVSRLLHLSREADRFRVCGIVSIGHSFLFVVMGNTMTYLVMLLQYPILTPSKAAAVLNQTETKSASA